MPESTYLRKIEYIITETGTYDSLDPLDADKTQNLPVARMIYATPVEISTDGKLSSRVLSKYEYDEQEKRLSFELKPDTKYSDGSSLSVEDVSLAILRMLFFRPDFPVIKYIIGKDEWLKSNNPLTQLPIGFKIHGNSIDISFSKSVPNSLFRLSLELFSIIPKKNVDLLTGKITGFDVPTSGLYEISSHTKSQIDFKLRDNVGISSKLPEMIVFKYMKLAEITLAILNSNTIISGNESDLIYSDVDKIKRSIDTFWLPSARFATLRFNITKPPFNEKLCRLYFSEKFRGTLVKLHPEIRPEGGVFTNLIPGYISHSKLREELYTLTQSEESYCADLIKKSNIHLAIPDNNTLKFGYDIMLKTFEEIGANKLNVVENLNANEVTELFIHEKLSIVPGASGFWAQDPAGDIEMYFTKNLHKTLKYIWSDDVLYKLIDNIDNLDLRSSFENLNRHLYTDSRLGIYMHYRRFFATKKEVKISNLNTSVSSPAPWELNLTQK